MLIFLIFAAALAGPPDPVDPRIAILEKKLEETKKIADGVFLDAALMGLGSAFDIWSTERCITHNPACYEINPLGKDSGSSRIALKAGTYPLKVGIDYIFRRFGHDILARCIAIGFFVVDVLVGIHNLDISNDFRPVSP